MWILFIYLTLVDMPEMKGYVNIYSDKDSCIVSMVETDANWRQAYPGEEGYYFTCEYMPNAQPREQA